MKDDDYEGCGINRIWATSEEDPFKDECTWHDHATLKGSWAEHNLTFKEVNKKFLDYMLLKAKNNLRLRARAYFYYAIVSIAGKYFWEGKK